MSVGHVLMPRSAQAYSNAHILRGSHSLQDGDQRSITDTLAPWDLASTRKVLLKPTTAYFEARRRN